MNPLLWLGSGRSPARKVRTDAPGSMVAPSATPGTSTWTAGRVRPAGACRTVTLPSASVVTGTRVSGPSNQLVVDAPTSTWVRDRAESVTWVSATGTPYLSRTVMVLTYRSTILRSPPAREMASSDHQAVAVSWVWIEYVASAPAWSRRTSWLGKASG